jgi:hypothetical protein
MSTSIHAFTLQLATFVLLAHAAYAIGINGFKKDFEDGFQQQYGGSAKHLGGGTSGFEGAHHNNAGHSAEDGHKK